MERSPASRFGVEAFEVDGGVAGLAQLHVQLADSQDVVEEGSPRRPGLAGVLCLRAQETLPGNAQTEDPPFGTRPLTADLTTQSCQEIAIGETLEIESGHATTRLGSRVVKTAELIAGGEIEASHVVHERPVDRAEL
jgi:hypothetical protein